jgi:hypothetical protein
MKTNNTNSFVARIRRAGPVAVIAACLAAGPAFAQTTVITTDKDKPATSTTKVKEQKDGDVVIKSKEKDRGDTMKSTTTIQNDGDVKTKTTVR